MPFDSGTDSQVLLMLSLSRFLAGEAITESPASFGHNQRMMILFFSNRADLVRELQRLSEVLEFEDFFQALHSFNLFNLPLMNMQK